MLFGLIFWYIRKQLKKYGEVEYVLQTKNDGVKIFELYPEIDLSQLKISVSIENEYGFHHENTK